MALGMLINGKWTTDWSEHDEEGNFKRMSTQFHTAIDPVSDKDRKRYSLYISYGCPWANRVAMVYELLALSEFIDLIVVEPHVGKKGWYFSEQLVDKNYKLDFLQELYLKNQSDYTGRVTVPVLWDTKLERIVNNESKEIIKILDEEFKEFSLNKIQLYPKELLEDIEDEIEYNYENINNACYRTGFAISQSAYEKEVKILFAELEKLNLKLSGKKYLIGDQLTGADIALLPTLLRFDLAYHGIFKANLKRLKDFENIQNYMDSLLEIKEIAKTFKPDHIKNLYYKIIELNPSGIVPLGSA